MALDFPVGTDFPANGDQIPDGEIYEGFYWDAAVGVWKRLCDRDKIGDCLDDGTSETVCDRLEFLQNEIIELEEEIDAIATSVGRGTYEWAAGVSNFQDDLPEGKFYMVKVDVNGGVLGVTQDYSEAGKFIFHETDLDGNLHTFDDQLVNDILMMFDRPDPDFFEGTVTGVTEGTNTDNTKYYIIDVTHASSQGSPTNNPDGEGNYKARLNIFEAPTGGGAGEFVKKIGDTMSGDLAIDRSAESDAEATLKLTGSRTNTTNAAATIAFENSQSPTLGYLTYRSFGGTNFFKFNHDLELNNKALTKVGRLDLKDGGTIGIRDASYPRIKFQLGSGNAGQACTEIDRPANNKRTFAIKGRNTSGSITDFFYSYANSSGADAIHYTGLVTSDNHIVNKKYVDSKAGGGVAISCNSSNRNVGDLWYCHNDKTLYLRYQ